MSPSGPDLPIRRTGAARQRDAEEPIREEFDDDITSTIDLDMTILRQPCPNGDCAKLTRAGKFLTYWQY